MNRRLYRSYDDRVLAGVAGGIAETYDFDPALVRVGWVLLALLTGGVFLIVYIAMALVVPLAPDDAPAGWAPGQPPPADPGVAQSQTEPAFGAAAPGAAAPGAAAQPTWQPPSVSEREWRRQRRAQQGTRRSDVGGALVIGLLLIGVGAYFLLREYLPAIAWGQLWPVAIIVVGLVLLIGAFRRSDR